MGITKDELEQLLHIIKSDDTISTEAVLNKMKKTLILKQHKFSIFYKPSEERWVTHVVKDGKKHIVKRKKESDLLDYLEALYKGDLDITLAGVYVEWIQGKLIDGPATCHKYEWVWNKYYENSALAKMPMKKISVEDIKDFFRTICTENSLTKKKVTEIKTTLNQLFDYAHEKEYCADNKARRLRNMGGKSYVARELKKPDEEEVFTAEEAAALCQTAVNYFQKTNNPLYLAIPLAFQIGTRIGEMIVLKFGDIKDGILTLSRSEIKHYITDENGETRRSGFDVVNHLKAGREIRTIPLTASAEAIINVLKDFYGGDPDDDAWLFQRKDGSSHHVGDLEKALERCCDHTIDPVRTDANGDAVALKRRSFHKIRKTFISSLLVFHAVPITTVRDLAGHSDAKMTLNVYGKTILPSAKVKKQMETALPDFNTLAL